MKTFVVIFIDLLVSGLIFSQHQPGIPEGEERIMNFPVRQEQVENMPARHNLWVFMLAGQSNMAGRGLVAPCDTLQQHRI